MATERSGMRTPYFAVCFIGLGIGLLHCWHVSTLFENDRHFSHLSEIEREMSFRTEMGMYYSYFKTIAESKDYWEGYWKLKNDNISEYGNVIDASRKYTILPELFAGYLYHLAKDYGFISVDQCWQIDRGHGLPPVTSCIGLGVPVYFYLEIVWLTTIWTVVTLFHYSVELNNSVAGGFVTILLFFYNHNECTRVQWTPPLRESFAYPMLLFQMHTVTMILQGYCQQDEPKLPKGWRGDLILFTAMSLCTWQFSHFVFATQIIALLLLKWTGVIRNDLYRCISGAHCWAIVAALIMTDNSTLVSSLYLSLTFASTFLSFMHPVIRAVIPRLKTLDEMIMMLATALAIVGSLKVFLGLSDDDEHIYNILKAKLTDYKDFHTMLYTCSAEFDFLPYKSYEAIIKTLLLPTAILAGILALYFWYRNYKVKGFPMCIEPHVAYNGLQTGAFIVMAVFIMRLKLLMNPHLCIIAGMVCSNRYLDKVGIKGTKKIALIVLLIAVMSNHGIERLREERSIIGEYRNIEQEELFEWIKSNTPEHAVFAGKMSLMANLMLSTKRPIVNNPYYENKEMRDRTMKVYEIYSRKDPASVYFTLRSMRVGYVVLEDPLYSGYANQRPGCNMIDLWDTVDNGTAKAAGKPPLYPLLFHGAYPFKRAFVNSRYVVLQLDYSHYVEYKPKTATPLRYQY